MVDECQPDSALEMLQAILEAPTPHQISLPAALHDDLLRQGAILRLQQIATDGAIGLLARLAHEAGEGNSQETARHALINLAETGSAAAIDAIYRLALNDSQLSIRQVLSTRNWQPSNPEIRILLHWLIAIDSGSDPMVDLTMLTTAFFTHADPTLQEQILARAVTPRYKNWARMVSALRAENETGMDDLITVYPTLSQSEQAICLARLAGIAGQNTAAQEAICRLFIEYDDPAARELAQSQGWLPSQPYARALFFFLSGNQERYLGLDFDHNLLISAYEISSRALRRRLLAFSRQTGQIEWLRVVNPASESRWLVELSDSDWESAVHRLHQQTRYLELWRLAQVAPPLWSAAILARLHQVGWLPAGAEERGDFLMLVRLALDCWQEPVALQPVKRLQSLSDDLICLAFNPQASLLAAGSSGQPIYLWQLPEGDVQFPALIGPASTTRAVQFSQDGELVIAASGDQRIRFFRHHNGQIIKTLGGHQGLIRSLALHPTGRVLVSADFDGNIRLWRFPIGTEMKRIQSDVKEIFSLAIFSNGELIASAGAGDHISVWSCPEGNLQRTLPTGEDGTLHLASAPTSDLLAAAGRDRVVTIWNAANGNVVRKFPALSSSITGLIFHPNDQLLITSGSDGTLEFWNITSGSSIMRLKNHPAAISAIALSKDGRLLASTDIQGAIYLWDLSTLLWLRTTYQPGVRLPLDELNLKLLDRSLPSAEYKWLTFTATFWKWIRRFEIDISEPLTIELGDFDIEL
jgi:WD40 repeat protein